MDQQLTISKVAHQSGLSIPNIRFYEAQGIIPAPRRTEAGYRLYSLTDVRRLRLARRARLLGLPLPEVKDLVERAFASECSAYAHEIMQVVTTQRARIDQRIAELQALRSELDVLERDARHVSANAQPGLTVVECGRCMLVDQETGEPGSCQCGTPAPVIPLETLMNGGHDAPAEDELLETLVCEVGRRPPGAPTFEDVAPFVQQVQREAKTLTIDFDPVALEQVTGLVDAERLCCSTIGWQLDTAPELRLRISASSLQFDALEQVFAAAE